MKANKTLKCFLPCLTVLAATLTQAHAADEGGTIVSGEITPKLIYFNHTGGPGEGLTPYLQSYGGQSSWDGDRDNGFYADFDVNLTLSDDERDVLTLERQGFGRDNHRGQVRGGNDNIGFSGYYSHFRVNTGGVDYLLRPGTADNPVATIPPYDPAGNGGYLTLFNDDSGGQTEYRVERTRYGLGVTFKPNLLGKDTSLSLNADGYERQGNKFATWVAGNGDITPNSAAQKQARWRGYDKPVDENMGRLSLNFTATPAGLFQFAYDGSIEKFNSLARTALMTDFQSAIEGTVAAPTGQTLAGDAQLHFVPDSTLMTHAIRLSRTFGNTAVAAGLGMSRLEQDTFSNEQIAAGYTTGEIDSRNAFLNLHQRVSPGVALEAYVKHYERDNDSTVAPPGGLLDRDVRDEWGVRINNIDSLTYGLSATFSGLPAKSSLTAGWKREDTDRDLQYNNLTATGNIGIWPTVSLYSDATVSDELYLKWVARPMQGMTLRVTPSVIHADKTGFVTEAEKSLNLKTALGYAMSQKMHFNAYYHYKDKENSNNSFYDTNKPTGSVNVLNAACDAALAAIAPLGPCTSYPQKADDTFHAAGISLNHAPSEWVTLNASLDWSQNDFETYYFGTNVRRFETNIRFDPRGSSDYKVDTWSLSLSAEYQPTDLVKLRAGYTLSKSEGDLITTTTALSDVVNDKIDNTLNSLALGADYDLKKQWKLRGSYVYDHYKDSSHPALKGGLHTLIMGVSLGF